MTSDIRLRHSKDADLYASTSDFCRVFKEDMENLYLLALLLTADSEKAEQCFVSGLENCTDGNPVFKEWARSWARRTVIKSAIRVMAPEPTSTNGIPSQFASRDLIQPELRAEISVLLDLQPFERFAFVMSVLEGYTAPDCATLLNCARQDVAAARTRALRGLAASRISPAPPVEAVGAVFRQERSLSLEGAA